MKEGRAGGAEGEEVQVRWKREKGDEAERGEVKSCKRVGGSERGEEELRRAGEGKRG